MGMGVLGVGCWVLGVGCWTRHTCRDDELEVGKVEVGAHAAADVARVTVVLLLQIKLPLLARACARVCGAIGVLVLSPPHPSVFAHTQGV